MTDNMLTYSRYVVNQYLKNKPELEDLRNDLEQEACMAYLRAKDLWDPRYGKDFDLYAYHIMVQSVQRYVRTEAKHFRKKLLYDDDSPYWDINEDATDVDELPSEEQDEHTAIDLRDILSKLDLTDRQREILSVWLETGEVTETANTLGIDKAHVSRTISLIISKANTLVNN